MLLVALVTTANWGYVYNIMHTIATGYFVEQLMLVSFINRANIYNRKQIDKYIYENIFILREKH